MLAEVLSDGRKVEKTVARTWAGLEFSLEVTRYDSPTVVEWTISVENKGSVDSGRFTRISPGDFKLGFHPFDELSVWRAVGEVENKPELEPLNYSFSQHALTNGVTERFSSSEGYPSFNVFPYFRVFSPKKGYAIAVGWQGGWAAEVVTDKSGARVNVRQETVDFYLKPGEKIVSPTVTVMPFGNHDEAVNGWRRFMRKWILPRGKDGTTHLGPILGINGQESGGLFEEITCDRQVDLVKIMRQEKHVDFDAWWVDAGWYIPKGMKNAKGSPIGWYQATGRWAPDPARFPHGLGPLSRELHKSGAKLVLWYEPERVHFESGFIETAGPYLSAKPIGATQRYDFSNPKAVDFISDIIVGSVLSNGVDIYRQDSNGPGPGRYWPDIDTARQDGRKGLAENFAVQNQFKLWECLRAAKPDLLFDTCAAGGRRTDLSTLRFPSVPLHYSDVGYWNFTEKQHYNHLMNEWLFYRKNIANAFHPPKTKGFIDRRHAVIDFAPMHMIRTRIFLNPARNADGISHEEEERQLLAIWRRCAPLMIEGDYYLLTPERFGDDTWWVTEFFNPQERRGFMQVVRNPQNEEGRFDVVPRGLRNGCQYHIKDAFSGEERSFVGGGSLSLELARDVGTILEFEESEE